MKTHHFTLACLRALDSIGISAEQFGGEVGLTRLGINNFMAGEPLPREIYRPAFKFFLRVPKLAHLAVKLGKACLLDSLQECGLDDITIDEIQRAQTSEATVAHMFGQLPIPYLVAMSVIANSAKKNPVVHNTMFGLAELCQAIAEDKSIPRAFFSQHWKSAPPQRALLSGTLGELTAKIYGVSFEE